MAECIFTSNERAKIDAIASELDDEIEEFFADAREHLTSDEWTFLVTYARACIRRSLEIGTLLRSIAAARAATAVPYPGRGQDTFVRDGLVAWRDSFAPVEHLWRLAPVFDKVEGGESRALADVAALEVMAANRMFTSLDDQYQALFTTDDPH